LDLAQHGGMLICRKDALLAAAKGVSIGIVFQKRVLTGLFGGEGVFFARLRGPGQLWLQSLPFSQLAGRIMANMGPLGRRTGEGSVLGPLGDMLGGR
jgi:uncharacterized protein (AIM24 family)